MVSIKQAVANAVTFAQDVLGANLLHSIRLEEVESNDQAWFITLSMNMPDEMMPALAAIGGPRVYKIFTVDKENGEVTAMKIRELANA